MDSHYNISPSIISIVEWNIAYSSTHSTFFSIIPPSSNQDRPNLKTNKISVYSSKKPMNGKKIKSYFGCNFILLLLLICLSPQMMYSTKLFPNIYFYFYNYVYFQ